MTPRAAIVGIAGPALQTDEARLFASHPPLGLVLFARNIQDPEQLRRLIADVRSAIPDPLLMLDQEGGRVARLRPPHWRAHPSAAAVALGGPRAAWLHGALIGTEAAEAGIDVVTAPVLDLRYPGASEVVGDRALSDDPAVAAALGRAIADGLLAAGIQPVGKHAPGHGQAAVDSHVGLPVVEHLTEADLAPFRDNADLPWMMTAHVVYRDWDPEYPATISPRIIEAVVRGAIGFGGLLVSDDLAMAALSGTPAARATASLAAGCDVALYCPGDARGTAEVLAAAPPLSDAAGGRVEAARAMARQRRSALEAEAMHDERGRLLA